MSSKFLITGATDGIGLETAKMLAAGGHTLLLHGRSKSKLDAAADAVRAVAGAGSVETYLADLSDFGQVVCLAEEVRGNHQSLDVLINNAGIFRTDHARTSDGLDIRFAVNTIAPYLLTQEMLPLLGTDGRVVNLSSAAQAPVDLPAIAGTGTLEAMEAYAQSKLAITMWSRRMGEALSAGPLVIAVNPGSLLASKMVKEGFGVAGSDLSIGADILIRAALSDEFAGASGKYFDNDTGAFATPHADALNDAKADAVIAAIEKVLADRI